MIYRNLFLRVTMLAVAAVLFYMVTTLKLPDNIKKLDFTTPWRTRNGSFKETQTKNNISNNTIEPIESGFKHCNKTFLSNHHITIGYPLGRLGNNIFQLLTLLGTAMEHCYTPVLTDQFYFSNTLKEVFDLSHFKRIPKVPIYWRRYGQPLPHIYLANIKTLDHSTNWSLIGYFQSWKYFDGHKPLIKSLLKFRKDVSESALTFMSSTAELRKKSKVCIHHRRGDFLRADHQRNGFGAAGIAFLNKAMQYFIDKLDRSQVVFILLSDEIEWSQKVINRNNVYYSPFSSNSSDVTTAGKDLALMSYCDHSIVTSGTFGWIGAWLGSGTVVYYKGYPTPGSLMDRKMKRDDYYPSYWVGIT